MAVCLEASLSSSVSFLSPVLVLASKVPGFPCWPSPRALGVCGKQGGEKNHVKQRETSGTGDNEHHTSLEFHGGVGKACKEA